MTTNTPNAPESAQFTAPELNTFAVAREAIAHLAKTFDQWIVIARAVELARSKADEIGGRSAFERILNQQGLAHALGRNWNSQKAAATKLLRILEHLPEVEQWRAELSREQRFAWQAPSTIYTHCPLFAKDKPERKPKPKADAEAIGEVTTDLRQAADKIVSKVSGAAMFDLSTPEMVKESASNFIEIYGAEQSMTFARTVIAMLERAAIAEKRAEAKPVVPKKRTAAKQRAATPSA
jgi:hypothetical protein